MFDSIKIAETLKFRKDHFFLFIQYLKKIKYLNIHPNKGYSKTTIKMITVQS